MCKQIRYKAIAQTDSEDLDAEYEALHTNDKDTAFDWAMNHSDNMIWDSVTVKDNQTGKVYDFLINERRYVEVDVI